VSQYGDFKLGDFGIARQIERTMSGLSKKGTYSYMAPEVFRGDEYGASVDTYSLGIVMYRFLNHNRLPFMPDFPNSITPHDKEDALRRRMSGEPLPPIPGADPSLNEIVLKACACDRGARFACALEMREALDTLKTLNVVDAPSEVLIAPTVAAPATPPPDAALALSEPTVLPERTEGIFAGRVEPFYEGDAEEMEPPELVAPQVVRALSISSGAFLFTLGALSVSCLFFGAYDGVFVFLPLYALCALQSALSSGGKYINILFLSALILYLAITFFTAFHVFDYHMLACACGILSLAAARGGGHRPAALCSALVVCSVASGFLVIRSIGGIASGAYNASVAGAVAVPVFTLLIAPAGLALTPPGSGRAKFAAAWLVASQFFPFAVFSLLVVDSFYHGVSLYENESVLYYIADADFTGLSPGRFPWWTNLRILGQLLQLMAFVPFFALALARMAPETFARLFDGLGGSGGDSRRSSILAIICSIAAMVVAAKIASALPALLVR
jgi:hypothetical protein